MSLRAITLAILLNGPLAIGVQAADLPPQKSSVSGGDSGLEALQPDISPSDLSSYAGVAKLIVIFADQPDDADFIEQIDILRSRADDLAERNVVLLTDTSPSENGPLREALRPRGFSLILINSTGTLTQRRRTVTDVRILIRQIDEMP
jgi:hypothetical protein